MINPKSGKKEIRRYVKIFIVPILLVIIVGIYLFQIAGKYRFDSSEVVNDKGILYLNTAKNVAYVGGKKCYTCHKNLSHSFRQSEMARSFEKLTADNIIENYLQTVPVYDEASNFYYKMFEENGKFYQEEYRLDNEDNVFVITSYSIHYTKLYDSLLGHT